MEYLSPVRDFLRLNKQQVRRMDLNVSAFRIVRTLIAENKDDKKSCAGRAGGKVRGASTRQKTYARAPKRDCGEGK